MSNGNQRRAKGENPRNFVGFTVKNNDAFRILEERARAAGIGKYSYAGSVFNALWEQIAAMDIALEKARALRVADPADIAIDKVEQWVLNALRTLRRENPGLMASAVLSLSVFAEDGGFPLPEGLRHELDKLSHRAEGDREPTNDRGAVRQAGRRKASPSR